jgi:high-affinity K+ transport system ATPase subunit B
VVLVSIGSEPSRIVVRFFDMITIAVPPALPACLTIATVFSIGRLRRIGIYVTGPHTITLAGQLDIVCFDKTGEHCLRYAAAWLQLQCENTAACVLFVALLHGILGRRLADSC